MENPNPSRPAVEREVEQLRSEFSSLVRVQLVLTVGLAIFVWRAAVLQHRTVVAARPAAARMQADVAYQRGMLDEIQKFAAGRPQLIEVLRRYGPAPEGAPAPGGAGTPPPAGPPPMPAR